MNYVLCCGLFWAYSFKTDQTRPDQSRQSHLRGRARIVLERQSEELASTCFASSSPLLPFHADGFIEKARH